MGLGQTREWTSEVVVVVEAHDQRRRTVVDGDVWLCLAKSEVIDVVRPRLYPLLRLPILSDLGYLSLKYIIIQYIFIVGSFFSETDRF